MIGIGGALMYGGMIWSSCLGFWYGSHCIEGSGRCPASLHSGSTISAGAVITTYFSLLMAVQKFIEIAPAQKKLNDGMIAAARIFKVIDREPTIASLPAAITPDHFEGVFRFESVTFSYATNTKC